MTNREFYLQRREAEFPMFMRVLKALPKDRLNYKPDERSPSAEQLVWTLTGALKSCIDAVKDNRAEAPGTEHPAFDEMLEMFERWSKELTEQVSRIDDKTWDQKAEFYHNGKLVSEQPIGTFLWFVLFDEIHHRGQLMAYLRPMGGKVPSIYGPSADEKPKTATAS